ncbi:hypothetical protein [Streptomyces sp. NBC_00009]|uniref:hypothetical protein n=1 Tax=Streptomyces sp. NBC_00009 TaxID=2975620 RepID=UPI003247607A
MSTQITVGATVTENADSLSRPPGLGEAVAARPARTLLAGALGGDAALLDLLAHEPGIFTGGAAQREGTPSGRAAARRDGARRRTRAPVKAVDCAYAIAQRATNGCTLRLPPLSHPTEHCNVRPLHGETAAHPS